MKEDQRSKFNENRVSNFGHDCMVLFLYLHNLPLILNDIGITKCFTKSSMKLIQFRVFFFN